MPLTPHWGTRQTGDGQGALVGHALGLRGPQRAWTVAPKDAHGGFLRERPGQDEGQGQVGCRPREAGVGPGSKATTPLPTPVPPTCRRR